MDTHIQGPVSDAGVTPPQGANVGSIVSQRIFRLGVANANISDQLCTIEATADLPILVEIDGYVEQGFNATPNTVVVGNTTTANAYITSTTLNLTQLGFQLGSKVLLRARTIITALIGTPAGTGTLTGSASTNVSNNDTVTIGSTVYTFKTALTPAAGEVLIAGSGNSDSSLLNLIRAINHSGTPGTDYANLGVTAVANTQVTAATSVTSNAFAVTAKVGGTAGNIASTETSAVLAWGGTTLTGGVNPTTGKLDLIIRATGPGKGVNILGLV